MPSAVSLPAPGQVPDWSAATLALFDMLTPLEQGVVQWMAAGYSAAESYRRASGNASPSARQSGYQIARRPRVAAALQAALADRNFSARADREWLLQRLYMTIEECERSDRPGDKTALIKCLRLLARVQGFLGGRRPPPEPTDAGRASTGVRTRFDDIVARVEAAMAGRHHVHDRPAVGAAARESAPPQNHSSP